MPDRDQFRIYITNEPKVPPSPPSETEKVEKCPFVSENGTSCQLCGAPPTSVNIDPGGYGFCDECGGRFRIR